MNNMVIKYRGLHTYEDEAGNILTKWVYGYPIIDEKTGEAYILNGVVEANDEYICIEDWREVDPETIGQFTDLIDINGSKIFEGDIVNVHRFKIGCSCGAAFEDEEELVGVIEYGRTAEELDYLGPIYLPAWLLRTKNEEYYFSELTGIHEDSFEIIGNIHENPELLEEHK